MRKEKSEEIEMLQRTGEYIVNITRNGCEGTRIICILLILLGIGVKMQGEYIVHFTRNGCEEAGRIYVL